jgi:8-oxo-dGTP diphosphatase
MAKPTVGAIITKQISGELVILLTKRNIEPFRNCWCIPGGHIEPDEEAHVAVRREVKEETNLDFEGEFLGYQDEIFPELGIHNVVLLYAGTARNVPRADPAEVSEIGWFTLPEIHLMKLAFRHNAAIDLYNTSMQYLKK